MKKIKKRNERHGFFRSFIPFVIKYFLFTFMLPFLFIIKKKQNKERKQMKHKIILAAAVTAVISFFVIIIKKFMDRVKY